VSPDGSNRQAVPRPDFRDSLIVDMVPHARVPRTKDRHMRPAIQCPEAGWPQRFDVIIRDIRKLQALLASKAAPPCGSP
jgi:hypothetical protein